MKQLLMFVLLSSMLCWMMFSPIYKHVYILRQALLQQEVDYLLEVGTNGQYGYISPAHIEQSRTRLGSFGLDPQLLQYEVDSTLGYSATSASMRVPRGEGISLSLSYPIERLFAIDALIGVAPPHKQHISAYGIGMSEYVFP